MSITYDKYYRTPRVFLFGYDEVGAWLVCCGFFRCLRVLATATRLLCHVLGVLICAPTAFVWAF
jgi:hypothetical protein